MGMKSHQNEIVGPECVRQIRCLIVLTMGAIGLAIAQAEQKVTHPFAGVTHVERTETTSRPLKINVLVIDLNAPGIRFLVTPHEGSMDTIKETTLHFLVKHKTQAAVNAHFFSPWPPPNPDPGTARLNGMAASNGDVYVPFYIDPNHRQGRPAINIDPNNRVCFVHPDPNDPAGKSTLEPVKLYNALAGNERILEGGKVTVAKNVFNVVKNPRTAIGITGDNKLVLLVVDGRQPGLSEGMTVFELAEMLRKDYGVTDAINLDGGGSTTMCLADPKPRTVNHVPGGTLRRVGCNLGIFAQPAPASQPREAK